MKPFEPNSDSLVPKAPQDDAAGLVLGAAFQAAEPSEQLRRRLQVKAHEAYTHRPNRWLAARWRPFAAVAGTVAVGAVVLLMTLTPSKAMAKSFALVERAVNQAKTFQLSILAHEKGKTENVSIVAADGRFAMRTSEGPLMKLDAGAMEIYDPNENTVTRINLGGIPGTGNLMDQIQHGIAKGMKEMDIKKMIADARVKYGDRYIAVSPTQSVDGKDVYFVTAESPDQPERISMTVDAATDLPTHIVVDRRDDGGSWGNDATIDLKFDQAVDPSLLKLDFPANAKHQDINLGDIMKGFGGNIKPNTP